MLEKARWCAQGEVDVSKKKFSRPFAKIMDLFTIQIRSVQRERG